MSGSTEIRSRACATLDSTANYFKNNIASTTGLLLTAPLVKRLRQPSDKPRFLTTQPALPCFFLTSGHPPAKSSITEPWERHLPWRSAKIPWFIGGLDAMPHRFGRLRTFHPAPCTNTLKPKLTSGDP